MSQPVGFPSCRVIEGFVLTSPQVHLGFRVSSLVLIPCHCFGPNKGYLTFTQKYSDYCSSYLSMSN